MNTSSRTSAQLRINAINARFDVKSLAGAGVASRGSLIRHKCFVSYHSDDTEEAASFVSNFENVFIPRAIGATEDDDIINSEDVDYLRDRIRQDYLRDSTVTIVLVGACTWARKFVDWEIYASLRDTSTSSKNGLLGIQLPSVRTAGATTPARLNDNLGLGSSSYASYIVYPSTAAHLRGAIERAFTTRTAHVSAIQNWRSLRQRNGNCPT